MQKAFKSHKQGFNLLQITILHWKLYHNGLDVPNFGQIFFMALLNNEFYHYISRDRGVMRPKMRVVKIGNRFFLLKKIPIRPILTLQNMPS